jgi:hypothetical protein
MSRPSIQSIVDTLTKDDKGKAQKATRPAVVPVVLTQEEPQMEYGVIPTDFADAVVAFRGGFASPVQVRTLQSRYGTEGFFFQALEDLHILNSWAWGREQKTNFRNLFRNRQPIKV